MRAIFTALIISLSTLCAWQSAAWSQKLVNQEFRPFVAEVTAENVNVRAGQSINFERLCQLDQGDEVVVVGKQFSWYKIQLPATAKSYVSKEYVQYLGQNAGGITADTVNIRAGAGIHHTVVGYFSRGEQVYILEDLEEWYRIEPVPESYGWIAEEYLAFKSKDTSTFLLKRAPTPMIDEEVAEDVAEVEVATDEEVQDIRAELPFLVLEKLDKLKPKHQGIISVQGTVKSHEDIGSHGIFFAIVTDGKPVCYVQGVNHLLGRFIGQEVSVEGVVNDELYDRYSAPVVTVIKVRLIL